MRQGFCIRTVLPQQEKQRGIDEKEEGDARGEEARNGVVHVEMVEFRRRNGVDRTRCDGEDENCTEKDGVADERIGNRHHKHRQDEKTQGKEVEGVWCIAACTVQVDECADGQHTEPRAEVDQPLKRRTDGGRAFDARRIECEPCRHAEDAELIPREKNIEEAHMDLAAAPVILVLQIVILCHGEYGEYEHEGLEYAHDLRVGKALLPVDDVGADPAEGGDVGHHCVCEVCAAIEWAPIFTDEERPSDKPRNEDDKYAVDRDEREIPRDRECPTAHEGERRVDDDDVQTQDAADERV